MTTEQLVESALRKYPKAKRIAVENFCFSCEDIDKSVNYHNLLADARSYKWNLHTVNAIKMVIGNQN